MTRPDIGPRLMHRTPRQLVTLALAALYAAVGVFGYGLHALLPCGDDACCSSHDGSMRCCSTHSGIAAGCDCQHPGQPSRPADSPAIHKDCSHEAHNAAECSLCGLLVQLRSGYVALPPPAELVQLVTLFECHYVALSASPLHASHDARGPPAGTLA